MSTQEDILQGRKRKKSTAFDPANMTLVSPDNDPNHGVLESEINKTDAAVAQRIADVSKQPTTPTQIAPNGANIVKTPTPQPLSEQTATKAQEASDKAYQQANPDAIKKSYTYDDLLELMGANLEAEQKRIAKQKRAEKIAAIGNGLSALANLYYTTKGAINSQTPEVSNRQRARYDELEKERKANSAAYLNSYLTLLGRKKANDLAEQQNEVRAQYYRDRAANDAAESQATIKLKEDAQKFNQEETTRKNNALFKHWDNQDAAAAKRANKTSSHNSSSGGGRGSSGKWTLLDENGNEIEYPSAAVYNKKVEDAAAQEGVSDYADVQTTAQVPNGYGGMTDKVTTTKQKRSIASKAAEVERVRRERLAKQRQTQTTPKPKTQSGGKTKKKTQNRI